MCNRSRWLSLWVRWRSNGMVRRHSGCASYNARRLFGAFTKMPTPESKPASRWTCWMASDRGVSNRRARRIAFSRRRGKRGKLSAVSHRWGSRSMSVQRMNTPGRMRSLRRRIGG